MIIDFTASDAIIIRRINNNRRYFSNVQHFDAYKTIIKKTELCRLLLYFGDENREKHIYELSKCLHFCGVYAHRFIDNFVNGKDTYTDKNYGLTIKLISFTDSGYHLDIAIAINGDSVGIIDKLITHSKIYQLNQKVYNLRWAKDCTDLSTLQYTFKIALCRPHDLFYILYEYLPIVMLSKFYKNKAIRQRYYTFVDSLINDTFNLAEKKEAFSKEFKYSGDHGWAKISISCDTFEED